MVLLYVRQPTAQTVMRKVVLQSCGWSHLWVQ
jgi:hypothetical protein